VAFFPALPEFAWMIVYDYFALLEGRKAIILRLQKTLMQHRATSRGDQEASGLLDLRRQTDRARQTTMPNRQSKKAFLNPDSG